MLTQSNFVKRTASTTGVLPTISMSYSETRSKLSNTSKRLKFPTFLISAQRYKATTSFYRLWHPIKHHPSLFKRRTVWVGTAPCLLAVKQTIKSIKVSSKMEKSLK
jgi:hypothetical protein